MENNKTIIVDIEEYILFLSKKGYNLKGPIIKSMIILLKDYSKFKGNPVPSLDKIKQLYNEYEFGKRTHINTLFEIGKVLQNGVETDKEQPKKEIYLCDCDNDECNPDLKRKEETCEKSLDILKKVINRKTPLYWYRNRETTKKSFHKIEKVICINPTPTLTKNKLYDAIFLENERRYNGFNEVWIPLWGVINDNNQYIEITTDRLMRQSEL